MKEEKMMTKRVNLIWKLNQPNWTEGKQQQQYWNVKLKIKKIFVKNIIKKWWNYTL